VKAMRHVIEVGKDRTRKAIKTPWRRKAYRHPFCHPGPDASM